MKKIILSFISAIACSLVMAQGFGPQAGDKALSLQLGKAASDISDIQYLSMYRNTYGINTPFNTSVSMNDNSLVNMIGVEGKYFLASNLAVRISGMGIITSTPAQQDIPGVLNPNYVENAMNDNSTKIPWGQYNRYFGAPNFYDPDDVTDLADNEYSVPGYYSVPSTSLIKYVVNAGADYYWSVGSDRVFPYTGVLASYVYGQRKGFTLDANDMGERITENYGFGGSLVGGIDYYVAQGFFIGIEIKAMSYMYSVNRIFPQPGMEGGDADNHTTTFFSNPMFKVGFKF